MGIVMAQNGGITSPDSCREEIKRENRGVKTAAADSVRQPKLLTLWSEKASSQILKASSECWSRVKAEDELISKWHKENVEKLHTAAREPVTLHMWSGLWLG